MYIKYLFLLFTFVYGNLIAEEFHINKAERSIVQPRGTLQVIGQYNTLPSSYNQGEKILFNLTYALTDNLEIFPLGFQYRFTNSSINETSVGFNYIGSSVSDIKRTDEFQAFINGKYFFESKQCALQYGVDGEYLLNSGTSSTKNGYIGKCTLEPMYGPFSYLTLSALLSQIYGDDGFGAKINHKDIGINSYFTPMKYFEFFLGLSYYVNNGQNTFFMEPRGYDFYSKYGWQFKGGLTIRMFLE